MSFIPKTLLTAALAAGLMTGAAQAADISGAGATFPYPIYAKWADTYKKQTNVGLNYQSIGSGGGIKQIKAKTVTFGASDMPLKAEELEEAGLVQFPMIMGGVVPVINLKGINAGQIKLDGATLGAIYLGEITKWNDPKIQALNAGVNLPSTAIAPVYRSDGSGTTFLFTDYLSKVNATFKGKIGANASVQWPVGIGAKGNEGVANMSRQTEGAIGYVEYAYAKQNKLSHVQLKNAGGNFVEPKSTSFQAAAANADWSKTPGYAVVLTNEPGAESWPIIFAWSFTNGGKAAEDLDYVPMPANVVKMVQQTWANSIKDAGGKSLWSASMTQ
jgi:phosphate transport system substrate-binding protein